MHHGTNRQNMNPNVDFYFEKEEQWQRELGGLRSIILDCGLAEELKWGVPCYTWNGANVLLIHAFREYCAILFHKGALLQDVEGVLVQQTKNVQAGRQIRFRSLQDVVDMEPVIRSYIHEAVEVERAGLKVEFRKTDEFDVPEEFQKRLDRDADLRAAFEGLTPGRQRGYLLHFGGAKKSETRESRIEKSVPRILEGKGLQDT